MHEQFSATGSSPHTDNTHSFPSQTPSYSAFTELLNGWLDSPIFGGWSVCKKTSKQRQHHQISRASGIKRGSPRSNNQAYQAQKGMMLCMKAALARAEVLEALRSSLQPCHAAQDDIHTSQHMTTPISLRLINLPRKGGGGERQG
jgi:hypothetical protein